MARSGDLRPTSGGRLVPVSLLPGAALSRRPVRPAASGAQGDALRFGQGAEHAPLGGQVVGQRGVDHGSALVGEPDVHPPTVLGVAGACDEPARLEAVQALGDRRCWAR
jgi:hypothetical protein